MSIEIIKIDNTDIFLDDQGNGKGKIIISNTYGYNYSYFWGSMGSSLKEFICDIDHGYFVNKLCHNDTAFCGTKSVRNLRKAIKDDMKYTLPWFKHMDFQKEMREEIKKLESCEHQYEFVSSVIEMVKNLPYYNIEDRYDRKEVESDLTSVLSEAWHFIETKPSHEAEFLVKLHKQLKKVIKSELVLEC